MSEVPAKSDREYEEIPESARQLAVSEWSIKDPEYCGEDDGPDVEQMAAGNAVQLEPSPLIPKPRRSQNPDRPQAQRCPPPRFGTSSDGQPQQRRAVSWPTNTR
jgi:hypothetical protein